MDGLRSYLDLHERDVLWAIFSRTRMYSKEWEQISINQFMHGIVSADGKVVSHVVSMGENKLLESLTHLEAKGIIEVRRRMHQTNFYRIREEEEIDEEHVRAYMFRHQRKTFESHFGRMQAKNPLRITTRDTPSLRGSLPPNGRVGVPSREGDIIYPLENTNSNQAAAPHGLRVLPVPSKPSSTSPRRITITKK